LNKAHALRIGWGGRDRTYECWDQNPVPYHLATPHLKGTSKNPDFIPTAALRKKFLAYI
jgi:hypothetical protein